MNEKLTIGQWPFLNFDVNQVCSKVWKLRRGEFNSRFFERETNNLILKRPSDAYLILIHEKLGENLQEMGPVKGLFFQKLWMRFRFFNF